MVHVIKSKDSSLAWFEAVRFIYSNGLKHGELAREVLDLVVEIEKPLQIRKTIDRIFKNHIGEIWIKKGAEPIFPENMQKNSKWYSSYWSRISQYKEKRNQIEYVINRLLTKPHSKQLVCVTFDPEIDIQPNRPYNPTMPCLVALDFKVQKGHLDLFALFRSHDFGRKAYGNYIGLGRLMKYICTRTFLKEGSVVCYSRSAHIRVKEFASIKTILQELEKYNPEEDEIITLQEGNKLTLDSFVSPTKKVRYEGVEETEEEDDYV